MIIQLKYNYSHEPLLECELLIVIPELGTSELFDDAESVPVGKGLFEQIEVFQNKDNQDEIKIDFSKELKQSVFIVHKCDEDSGEILISGFKEFEQYNNWNYVNYGSVMLNEDSSTTLRTICEERFGENPNYEYLGRKQEIVDRYPILTDIEIIHPEVGEWIDNYADGIFDETETINSVITILSTQVKTLEGKLILDKVECLSNK